MRPDIAELVYPVFDHALKVKAQLARGDEGLSFQNVQSALKGLLKSDAEARRWHEFAGDANRTVGGGRSEGFLGTRYALVCWLDEVFLLDSPWKSQWNERKLETALYESTDRAWKFWEQARRAESQPKTDALEVFYLCVMLGFRGDYINSPEKLIAWRDATEAHLKQGQEGEWPGPVQVPPPSDVPPLTGTKRQQNAILALGAAILLVIAPLVFYVVSTYLNR